MKNSCIESEDNRLSMQTQERSIWYDLRFGQRFLIELSFRSDQEREAETTISWESKKGKNELKFRISKKMTMQYDNDTCIAVACN